MLFGFSECALRRGAQWFQICYGVSRWCFRGRYAASTEFCLYAADKHLLLLLAQPALTAPRINHPSHQNEPAKENYGEQSNDQSGRLGTGVKIDSPDCAQNAAEKGSCDSTNVKDQQD